MILKHPDSDEVVNRSRRRGKRKKSLLYEWARINELLDKQLYLTRLESKIETCILKRHH